VLAALSYNSNPQKLQTIIRRMFALATEQISLQVTYLSTCGSEGDGRGWREGQVECSVDIYE
jgi:hypothetical protein